MTRDGCWIAGLTVLSIGVFMVVHMALNGCGPLRYITAEDRQAVADGRAKVQVIGNEAEKADLDATARTARSADDNLAQGQQALGDPATANPVAESIQQGIRAEFTGDAQLKMQAELNGLRNALEQQDKIALELTAEADRKRQEVEVWKTTAKAWLVKGALASGGGMTLLTVLAAMKRYGPALTGLSESFRSYKHVVEAGGKPPQGEELGTLINAAVQRNAGVFGKVLGAKGAVARAHRKAKRQQPTDGAVSAAAPQKKKKKVSPS